MSAIILLVEDNIELNKLNCRALELEGYTVLAALTLTQARAHLERDRPDIILLDVMLPDGDGMAFCGEIREQTDAHILFLTSKTEDEDHLRGLVAGGDDYIKKPYRMELLLARVAAAVRRREMAGNAAMPGRMERGKLLLDTVSSQAYWDGEDLRLTQKELALLLLLARGGEESVAGEVLYESVWQTPMAGDSSALRTQLSRLKGKLEVASGGAVTIFSVRGEGYCLVFE